MGPTMVERDGKERSATACHLMVMPWESAANPWHPCAVSLRSCPVEWPDFHALIIRLT